MTEHTIAVVTTTVATPADARQLATQAVQARLAACAQVEAITAHYRWQGALHEDAEWRVAFKTTQAAAPALLDWLQARHPYDLPQLLAQPVQASAAYAAWVRGEVALP